MADIIGLQERGLVATKAEDFARLPDHNSRGCNKRDDLHTERNHARLSFAALHLRARSRVDDTLDAFACHGVAGVSGALLTGVFATTSVNAAGADGALSGNWNLLGVQTFAVLATMAFLALASYVLLALVRAVMPVRVGVDAEVRGVDISEHGEEAYHGNDLTDFTGRRLSLNEPVVLPVRSLTEPGVATVAR